MIRSRRATFPCFAAGTKTLFALQVARDNQGRQPGGLRDRGLRPGRRPRPLPEGVRQGRRGTAESDADGRPAISYWERLYIGEEALLLYGGDLKTVAVFKETMGGRPNPLEAIETVMHLTDYAYGGGITVVLPPEAANAPEVTLPPAGEGTHRSKDKQKRGPRLKRLGPDGFKGDSGGDVFRLFPEGRLKFRVEIPLNWALFRAVANNFSLYLLIFDIAGAFGWPIAQEVYSVCGVYHEKSKIVVDRKVFQGSNRIIPSILSKSLSYE